MSSNEESKVVLCQSSSCPNGNPPSRLECPTCNKLGIQGSFFCGQACFKAGCKTHKIIHDLVKSGSQLSTLPEGVYNPFPNYQFTGALHPWYPLSAKRQLPEHIPRPDYSISGKPMSEIKQAGQPPRILPPDEQEKMRTVCRLAREVLDIAASHVRPGITTDELDEIVHNACIERNAYPSPLNYRGFPKSVCTSVNEVICHGIPDKRPLREGDIVNIDVTLYYQGYHGDLNETYPVGKIDDDSAKLIRVTEECLNAAIALCKPGALFRDLGKVIEPIAKAAGCSVVRTYTGHGINDLFHCSPNIPHYSKNKAIGTMKAGMVFTIEPMINLGPSWSDVHWPDNWTATTADGKRSAQFEDTLLITETGVEILTAGSRHAKPTEP
ncbi:peptidase M24, structural domain-containing protein [Ephemerocybe angulata]|uniref:Methionine aminopeptidase n=1 Tax=Ephemerocybe angulata TaxID=980116 RepID=A0A8H6IIP3_9AGAR|nr:peptidase M24, structural domain-containing protein [Tulosesus angulatus]